MIETTTIAPPFRSTLSNEELCSSRLVPPTFQCCHKYTFATHANTCILSLIKSFGFSTQSDYFIFYLNKDTENIFYSAYSAFQINNFRYSFQHSWINQINTLAFKFIGKHIHSRQAIWLCQILSENTTYICMCYS